MVRLPEPVLVSLGAGIPGLASAMVKLPEPVLVNLGAGMPGLAVCSGAAGLQADPQTGEVTPVTGRARRKARTVLRTTLRVMIIS
jgi:hypothetical protein